SLCNLCVLCVSVVDLVEKINHRDTENTEVAQRGSYLDPGRRLLWIGETDLGETNKQRRSFLQGDFGVDLGQVWVVCALGEVGQHDVFRAAVKALANPVSEIFVRKVSQTRQDTLFQLPRIIVAGLEHVAAVIRLDHDRGATTQTFGDECRNVTEVHHGRDLHPIVCGSETEVVHRVVRNRERMKVDLADTKIFARLDLLNSIAQSFRTSTRLVVSDVNALADVSVKSLA